MRISAISGANLRPAAAPSETHAQSAPASVATPAHGGHAGVFAGLRAAPGRPVRPSPRPVLACATPSPADHVPDIDTALVDLAGAIAQVDFESSRTAGHRPQLELQRHVVLECMRTCAGEAYTSDLAAVPDIGKLRFDAGRSSPRLKLWEGSSDDVLTVVLGFSGTRMEEVDDLLCDVKSQLSRQHVNMLDERLPTLGQVAVGWQDWWHAEARQPRGAGDGMKEVLARYADIARESGKALSISLSGHSLGAAAATLAGFDIAHFLRATGGNGKVSVYAFNPPRMGPKGIEIQYMNTLKSEQSPLRFSLRQFTRALDPIQSTPLFMHHPHWNHDAGRGAAGEDGSAQFVTCTAPAANNVNLAVNHDLALWRDYFASNFGKAELQTIFEPPKAPAVASDATHISRRQLLSAMLMRRQAPPQPPPPASE